VSLHSAIADVWQELLTHQLHELWGYHSSEHYYYNSLAADTT